MSLRSVIAWVRLWKGRAIGRVIATVLWRAYRKGRCVQVGSWEPLPDRRFAYCPDVQTFDPQAPHHQKAWYWRNHDVTMAVHVADGRAVWTFRGPDEDTALYAYAISPQAFCGRG